MKKDRLVLAIAALLSVVACNKEIPLPIDDDVTEPVIEKDETRFACNNVCWIGAQNEYYNEIASRTASVSSNIPNGTSVIFLDMSAMNANLSSLGKPYDDNSVIVVTNPNMGAITKLMERGGWAHMYPSEGDIALYAFSKQGAYAVYKVKECEVEGESESIPGAEATYSFSEKDLEGPELDPYAGYDFSEMGYYLRPFVEWVNGVTSGRANDDLEGYALYTGQQNYDLKLYVHHVALSSKDYIKGPYSVSVNYKYKPMYIFADQSYNPGDYYLFGASYISETGKIFQGEDFTRKHGGITVHIKGAFLRELGPTTYIDGSSPKFIQGFEPIPESDIDVRNYTKTHSWNVGGGVTGGYSQKDSAHGDLSFNWGVSNSSTVSYTVSDLGIMNDMSSDWNGHGASPSWYFKGQNLPGPKGDKGFNGDTPKIAKSTGTFQTSWVWYCPTTEGDKSPIGDIVTLINPVLGGAHNGLCVDGEKNTWNIDQAVFKTAMVVPHRIPFGTARINNTFKNGEILSDIVVTNHASGEVAFTSSGDFSASKPCEFSVATGEYDITMNVTDSNRQTVRYKLITPIQLQRRTSENDIYDIDSYVRFQPE